MFDALALRAAALFPPADAAAGPAPDAVPRAPEQAAEDLPKVDHLLGMMCEKTRPKLQGIAAEIRLYRDTLGLPASKDQDPLQWCEAHEGICSLVFVGGLFTYFLMFSAISHTRSHGEDVSRHSSIQRTVRTCLFQAQHRGQQASEQVVTCRRSHTN